MSEREEAQQRLVEYLNSDAERWDAPYGVIAGMQSMPNGGKVRNVTFGVSRYLDATATLWSTKKITVKAEGSLASGIEGEYSSVDDLIDTLKAAW